MPPGAFVWRAAFLSLLSVVACTSLDNLHGGASLDASPGAAEAGTAPADVPPADAPPADAQPADAQPPLASPDAADTSVAVTIVDADVCTDGPCTCSDGLCAQKLVFVTSAVFTADLGGLAGGDAKCQAEALTAKRRGAYKAWLSDGITGPSARLTHATVPYVLGDGTRVADDWANLTSGSLKHAIDQKLDGSRVALNEGSCPGMSRVWSGAFASGLPESIPNITCGSWTSATPSATGAAADAYSTTSFWSYGCGATCDSALALYCFEQ